MVLKGKTDLIHEESRAFFSGSVCTRSPVAAQNGGLRAGSWKPRPFSCWKQMLKCRLLLHICDTFRLSPWDWQWPSGSARRLSPAYVTASHPKQHIWYALYSSGFPGDTQEVLSDINQFLAVTDQSRSVHSVTFVLLLLPWGSVSSPGGFRTETVRFWLLISYPAIEIIKQNKIPNMRKTGL